MLLQEVARELQITKRAIKYYEEQGFIKPNKLENGYRDYSEQDIEVLQKIILYRKLSISIQDIKKLIQTSDQSLLQKILEDKQIELHHKQEELQALQAYMQNGNIQQANACLDYEDVLSAISTMLPGIWGEYIQRHFKPFLQIQITTQEQKDALKKLLEYCDQTTIKTPLLMRLSLKFFKPKQTLTAQEYIEKYENISEEAYQKLKKQTMQGVKVKTGIMRFHPIFISQRRFQLRLQNCGYNDIFLTNMKRLSPSYARYKNALDSLNERICNDLGLYYDAKFQLRVKK